MLKLKDFLLCSAFSLGIFLITLLTRNSCSAFDAKTQYEKIKQLEQGWAEVSQQLDDSDSAELNIKLNELVKIKQSSSYKNLSLYSEELLSRGSQALNKHDLNQANFLYDKALELSPTSIKVRLKSFRIGYYVKNNSPLAELTKLIALIPSNPSSINILITLVSSSLISAWVTSLYIIIGLIFAIYVKEIRTNYEKIMVKDKSDYWKLWILPLIVIVPSFCGPLWCLTIWSIILSIFLPRSKQLCLLTALCVIITTALIPFENNLKLWNQDSGMDAVLESISNDFNPKNAAKLEKIAEQQIGVPEFDLAYAKTLILKGEVNQATEIFSKVSKDYDLSQSLLFFDVLRLLQTKHPDLEDNSFKTINTLMPFTTPTLALAVALSSLILILFLNTDKNFAETLPEKNIKRLKKSKLLFLCSCCIPGGIFVMVRNLPLAFITAFSGIISITPIIIGGKNACKLFQVFPGYYVIYLAITGAITGILYLYGFYLLNEKNLGE